MSNLEWIFFTQRDRLKIGAEVGLVADQRTRGDTAFNAQMPKKRFEQFVIAWN